MASKVIDNEIENNPLIKAFKSQINELKLEQKRLSDENHSLRIKMAADGKKLAMVREWITNFSVLSDHLKEIAKDWEEVAPVQSENNKNASNSVAKLDGHQRPMDGLRVMLNRPKLASFWPTARKTPTGILQARMLDRLQKNILTDDKLSIATQAPGTSSSSIGDDVEIKTEIVDEEAEKIEPFVDPVSMKSSTTSVALVETPTVKKRKTQKLPKIRQTRSKSKATKDDELSAKRFRFITPEPVLNEDDDGPTVSRSKSHGGKIIKRSMKKHSSKN